MSQYPSIVPQLSKCLKFEAILGDQTDQIATFSYRVRGTCGPSTRNYSLNGAANVWKREFSSQSSLNVRGRRIKFIIMQLIEISTL